MLPRIDDSPEFEAMIAGETSVDPTAVALELARDAYPDLDPKIYLARVAALADRIKSRLPAYAEPWIIVEAINTVLFREEGFHGNSSDYYDPRNSYLNEVIDRHVGIPISLSILYLALSTRLGLPLAGVNLPAHFVLRTLSEDEPLFIDPFHEGRWLDQKGAERLVESVVKQPYRLTNEQLMPCSLPSTIARMLQNLKTIYLRQRRIAEAIPVLRRLAVLRPESSEDLRDLGIACFYGDRRSESYTYLEDYLKRVPFADDAREIRLLLNSARIH